MDRDQLQPPIALGVMENSVLRTKSKKSHKAETSNYPKGKMNITPNEIGGARISRANNP